MRLVLPLVHGILTILPSKLVTAAAAAVRCDCIDLMDSRSGLVAAARLPAGVFGQIDFLPRLVARWYLVLRRQLLDLRHYRERYWNRK